MGELLFPPKFIADCHLGRVAKYLRILGYDTLYFTHIEDSDLIRMANEEGRIILTRDRELSERKHARAFLLRATDTPTQLKTILEHFGLSKEIKENSRCTVCNTPLESVDKAEVIDRLPEGVKKHFEFFERCPNCNRIYWHGDHYRNMVSLLDSIE
jgi:uncharacterized protein with PIN domain